MGFDFYRNMLRYYTHTRLSYFKLNPEDWSTSLFRFKVGDVYEVVPFLKEKYGPTEDVRVTCGSSVPVAYL